MPVEISAIWIAIVGNMLLAGLASFIGVLAYLQKRSLTADAVSHAALPGICIAYLIVGHKDFASLSLGAFASGLAALWLIGRLSRGNATKSDTAIALSLTTFFALGIFLLTQIQHQANGSQSGLDAFLFGKAATLLERDLFTYLIFGFCALAITLIAYKPILFTLFDEAYLRSAGFPTRLFKGLASGLLIVAVLLGIQSVGVVLMAALLITPVSAALFFSRANRQIILIAFVFGVGGGLGGTLLSYFTEGVPTGPAVVVSLSLMAGLSALLAPQRGIVAKWWRRQAHQLKVDSENALKAVYLYQERTSSSHTSVFSPADRIFDAFSPRRKRIVFTKLKAQKQITAVGTAYTLTALGLTEAMRIVRLHRLWEIYLTNEAGIAPDHVHDDAESLEHLITPEIEQRLEALLNYPQLDPHQKQIPR